MTTATATATPVAPAPLRSIDDDTLRRLAIATDSEIAELDETYGKLQAQLDRKISTLRNIDGQKARYVGRRREFTATPEETVESVIAKLAAETIAPWEVDSARDAITARDILRSDMVTNRAAAAALHDVWAANGYWTRFFVVQGGHIHSDISNRCSRTYTTQHGWTPALSGATEAAAVAELGPLLCTHCFPSAPVEFTVGHAKPEYCPGADKAPAEGTRKRQGMNTYGGCTECAQYGVLVGHGSKVRKHQPVAQ